MLILMLIPLRRGVLFKVYGAAAAQQTKKAVKHGLRKGMLVPEPEVIELA